MLRVNADQARKVLDKLEGAEGLGNLKGIVTVVRVSATGDPEEMREGQCICKKKGEIVRMWVDYGKELAR